MLKKIKKQLAIATASILLALSLGGGVALAQANIQDSTCQGSNLAFPASGTTPSTTCSSFTQQESDVNTLISTVINIFSIVVGIIAVIMIVYGGFRYITSGGDTTKVTTARNTILYAIIGLIVVALAQFIVKFVLKKATDVA